MKVASALVGILISMVSFSVSVYGQTPFQNLDFEAALVPDLPPSGNPFVPFSTALPGWTGYFGSNLVTQAVVNTVSLGSYNISILGHNAVVFGPLQGNFSAVIQAGFIPFQAALPATLAQTGFVPASTLSLQMRIRPNVPTDLNDLQVTLGGQNITMIPLFVTTNYTLFGGNIAAFADQTEELRITALSLPAGANTTLELDSIVFSSQPVPEPGATAIALLTTLALVCRSKGRCASHICPYPL